MLLNLFDSWVWNDPLSLLKALADQDACYIKSRVDGGGRAMKSLSSALSFNLASLCPFRSFDPFVVSFDDV